MPDNTIDWGQGSANNDIGWGKGPINNDLSWGMIGEDSYGHDETNLMGGGASFINTFGQPAMGLSLRDLLGTDPNVLRVRRDSDDAEADFKASEVSDGTLLNWVNQTQTLFDENFASSTGWTLRSGATISGGNLNLLNVTNSAEAAYKSFGSIPFQKVLITITVTDYVQGAIYVTNLGGGGDTSPNIIANGTYTYEITLGDGNTNWGIGTSSGPTTLKVSNLKVEEISANGLVRTWYGQGNSVNAEQTTANAQPFIVQNGSLITSNGLPALLFNGTSHYMNVVISTTQPSTYFSVVSDLAAGVLNRITDGATSGDRQSIFTNAGRLQLFADNTLSGNLYDTSQYLLYALVNGASSVISDNTNEVAGDAGTSVITGITIGARWDGVAQFMSGKMQSLIMYDSDKSIEHADIETNINGYYSIY